MNMKKVVIKNNTLEEKAQEGMDAFVQVFVDAINESIGGQLTAETMATLNADQITLLGYNILREEVMDGGFVQLIHNGYGPFFFKNPFGKMMREWGIDELATLINRARSLYNKYHKEIERECTDEEFMALFEQMPQFDDCDDLFVENEEQWTAAVAYYIDEHIDRFVEVE
jgi:hypothetical protein